MQAQHAPQSSSLPPWLMFIARRYVWNALSQAKPVKFAEPKRCSMELAANPSLAPTLKNTKGRTRAGAGACSRSGITRESHTADGHALLRATRTAWRVAWQANCAMSAAAARFA